MSWQSIFGARIDTQGTSGGGIYCGRQNGLMGWELASLSPSVVPVHKHLSASEYPAEQRESHEAYQRQQKQSQQLEQRTRRLLGEATGPFDTFDDIAPESS